MFNQLSHPAGLPDAPIDGDASPSQQAFYYGCSGEEVGRFGG
jgi:hypothetical protein